MITCLKNKILKNKIKPFSFFYLSFFLFRLPNIYFIPIFKTPFLTTHALARIILIVTFFLSLKKFDSLVIKNKKLLIVISLFLIQSLSILQSVNLFSFFTRYKELIVGLIAFYIGLLFQKKTKKIIKIMFLSSIINIIIQFLFLLFPGFFIQFYSYFFYEKIFDLIVINFTRNRTYFETFDEIIIPIIFLFYIKNRRNKNRKWLFLLFITLIIVVIFSGWRIRVLLLFFTITTSILFIKTKLLNLFFFFSIFLSVVIFSKYISYDNVFNRFELNQENISSLNSRISQLYFSYEIVKTKPLGLGLGNYYDNLPAYEKNNKYLIIEKNKRQEHILAKEYVHNIFGLLLVESGIPSFIVFLILLLFFLRNDYILFSLKDYNKITFMIGFWTIFIYSLFNPLISGSLNFIFWFLRGYSLIIHKKQH